MSAGNFDLAVDVLKLNLHAFPQHVDSHLALAKLYLAKGQREQARATLRQALAIDPGHSAAAGLLETIQ
jgi:Tfp pilus assembly protein PilF